MTWLTTFSGQHLDFSNPNLLAFNINDIAQGLSHECRFAGQIAEFYSVAQHSVLCSLIVPPQCQREALLHDATEAYMKDIPSPLKCLLPDYARIEKSIDTLIREKYELPPEMSALVKTADLIMLATERRDLEVDLENHWPVLEGINPADFLISPLNPVQARALFMRRWEELMF
ncbi:HD family hydrolase [Ewingella sp. S1.OA.A_B6]